MKYLKLYESFDYNIQIFKSDDFYQFLINNYGFEYDIKDRIKYFDYDDFSSVFGSKEYLDSLRFIVAYNKKDILGVAKIAYYSMQESYAMSYLSTNNSYFNRNISKGIAEEMFNYFSKTYPNETLSISGYSISGWKYLRKTLKEMAKKYNVKLKEKGIEFFDGKPSDEDLDLFNKSREEIQKEYPGTYPEYSKFFKEMLKENNKSTKDVTNLIKEKLLEDIGNFEGCEKCGGSGYNEDDDICDKCDGQGEINLTTWENFVDEQELGDCQNIVNSIKHMKIPGVETHFGEIEIVDYPIDEDDYGKIMTHHWVTYNNEILEFSKGTLKDYIYWNDLYSIYDDGEIEYNSIMLKESKNTPELSSGKAAFKLFLKIINSNDNLFSTKNYLNRGKYLYFFYTDAIKDNQDIIDELEVRTSLETAYKTIYKLKDKRLSFFFAVDEFKLFYGFYDDITHYIYKVGKYNVHDTDLRNLPELDCLKSVNDVLIPDVDIKKRRFVNEIKEDFKKLFPNTKAKLEVVSSTVIRKEYELDKFKEEDQDYNALSVTLDRFTEEFSWYNKVHTYIELDTEYVYFYIKVV